MDMSSTDQATSHHNLFPIFELTQVDHLLMIDHVVIGCKCDLSGEI